MGDAVEMIKEEIYPGVSGDNEEVAGGALVRLEDLDEDTTVGTLVPMPMPEALPAAPAEALPLAAVFDVEEAQWNRIMQFAQFAAASQLYGDETDMALAMKALIGTRLGLDIATSFHALQQIRGRINIPAEVQRALARRAGYHIRQVELTDTRCTLQLVDLTGETVGESTFTWEDAKRAKLLGNEVWHQYPRRMLLARCSTDLIGTFAPEVLYFNCGR